MNDLAGATLRILPLRPDTEVPRYATEGAAGMDLRARLDAPRILEPGAWEAIPTGLAMQIPTGHEGQVRPRSGLARRHGLTVLNAPGTIDEDYRGEVQVLLINHGREPVTVENGERIAQLVIAEVTRPRIETVDDAAALDATERGEGGFGSTGSS
ncbi:MAG: dUTP diphosphatase [Sandaracinaceae bacterium]